MKKFKVTTISDQIVEVVVERETEKSVWINGRKSSKRSNYENFFDTWEDAYAFLLGGARKKVISAERTLENATNKYNAILSISNPYQ